MLSDAAQVLRREFDLSFARAARAEAAAMQHLLAVRIGGDPYAIGLDEIAGLFSGREIVPLPTPLPELLGLAGFRGQVAPVYDLAALLGYARRQEPRWLVLVRHLHPVALAFDAFEAQLVASPEQIVPIADAPRRNHSPQTAALPASIAHAVRGEHGVHPIVRLPAVVEDIQRRVDLARYTKES